MGCDYLADGSTACCHERETTDRTHGVWSNCDDCGHDWWCVVGERDYMDEPVTYVCSGGCDDGRADEDYWEEED